MATTVNAKTIRAALGAAKAVGLDVGALADTWGLVEAMTDVDARFAHSAWLGVWQDIIRQTGIESIGIDAAERLPWGHFDVIDYLFGTAADLGTALRRFERYFALISTGVTHALEQHGATVHLVRRYAPDCYTQLLAPAEFAFASVVIRLRMALGIHWCPLAVHFAAPAPSNDEAQRRLFGFAHSQPHRLGFNAVISMADARVSELQGRSSPYRRGFGALRAICAVWPAQPSRGGQW